MIQSRYLSAVALAALLGSANMALAGDAPKKAPSVANPPATATSTASASKPLCSSLNHPNAGKLASKDTGMAKEHSRSPVHTDCIPDSKASTGASSSAPSVSTNLANSTSNQPARKKPL